MKLEKMRPLLPVILLGAGCSAGAAWAPGDKGVSAAAEGSAVAHCYDLCYCGESTISRTALRAVFEPGGGAPGEGGEDHVVLEVRGELKRLEVERDAGHCIEHVQVVNVRAPLRATDPVGKVTTIDLGPSLQRGFFVASAADGRVMGVAVAAGSSEVEARLAQSLACLLQWSRCGENGGGMWRVEEARPNGVAGVEYISAPAAGQGMEMHEVRRRCVRFEPPRAAANADLDLGYAVEPAGELVAVVPATGEGWTSLSGCESLRAAVRGRQVTATSECVEVQQTCSERVSAAAITELRAECGARVKEAGWIPIGAAAAEAEEDASHRLTLGKDTAATLEAALARVEAEHESAGIGRLTRKLAALLVLHPGEFGRFEACLRSGCDSWRFKIVVGALAASGSAGAQAHLVTALREEHDIDRLVSMLIGVADCRRPGGALVKEVAGLADRVEREVRGTALLVLGALAGASEEGIRTGVVGDLGERLKRGPVEERRLVVLALGNAEPAELAEMLGAVAGAPDPATRGAVAQALAGCTSGAGEALLARLACEDGDAEVRSVAAMALAERARGAGTWARVLHRLEEEPDADVRLVLLRSLWRRAAELEGLEERTRAVAARDASDGVRELAERLLGAHEGK